MIKVIIIEDETPAYHDLLNALRPFKDELQVVARLETIKESIAWFLARPASADLIFSDVQLGDGLSFEIFKYTTLNIPIIFVTAYNEFMLNAFEYNSIDYLLKPVDSKNLSKAIHKYKMLETHFSSNPSLNKLMDYLAVQKKKRLIVKKGVEYISLRIEEIAFFYTENKIVYVIDHKGKKFITDKNLSELELELDDTIFFRANRQHIVNVNYIKGYKTFEKVKLQIDLSVPDSNEIIIVSQDTAPFFREWMQNA